jgi:hypothetical protein
MIGQIAMRQFRAVLELWAFQLKTEGIITDEEFKARLSTKRANYLAVLKRCISGWRGALTASRQRQTQTQEASG